MRATDGKILNIPLATGMDESFGQAAAPLGTLYAVTNARIRWDGMIQKRCGTTTVDASTNVPSGAGEFHGLTNGSSGTTRPTEHPMFVTSIGEQKLAATTAGDIFSRGETKWSYRGSCSTCLPIDATAALSGADAFNDLAADSPPAYAVNPDGYTCVAAIFQDEMAHVVIKDPTGAIVYTDQATASHQIATAPIKAFWSDYDQAFCVYYKNGKDLVRAVFSITFGNVSSGAGLAGAVLIPDPLGTGAANYWDADFDSANGLLYIIYQATVATMNVDQWLGTGQVFSKTIAVAGSPCPSIWFDDANNKVWVGQYEPSPNEFVFYVYTSSNLTLSVGRTLLAAGNIGAASPPLFGPSYIGDTSNATFVFSDGFNNTAGQRYQVLSYGQATAAGAVGTISKLSNMMPVTKPDAQQRVWCITTLPSSLDAVDSGGAETFRFVLLRLEDANYLQTGTAFTRGTPIELATAELVTPGGFMPHINGTPFYFHRVGVADDFYAVAFGIPVAVETTLTDPQPTTQVQLYRYDTPETHAHKQTLRSGDSIIIPGAPTEMSRAGAGANVSMRQIGSVGATEIGYVHAAAILSATASAAGSGLAPGTYLYLAVYQTTDEFGRRVLSAPGAPIEVEVTVTSSVSVEVAQHDVGQRVGLRAPTTLLYRTVAGGVNYQLVPIEATSIAGNVTIFTDIVPDETLSENEFIYTDGGALPNVLAPSCRFMCAAEDRLWCGSLWDPKILEASKIRIPGEPWEFTGDPSHQVVLPENCTGLAYMDGQVVAFAENAIYLVGGDGPNDQGAGGFLPPRLLTRGIGCEKYWTILETPAGILFRSSMGLYLLPRGFGAPQFIGARVQDTLTDDQDILSAAFTSTTEYNLARFLLANGSGNPYGRSILTYDIDQDAWFKDDYAAVGSTSGGGVVHGFSEIGPWQGGLAFFRYELDLHSGNPIWTEDESVFTDAGAADNGESTTITRGITTSYVWPFGFGGWGLVNKAILSMSFLYQDGPESGTANVRLSFGADSGATIDSWSFVGGATIAYRGFDITSRHLSSFQVVITDTSANRGPTFFGLTLEAEPSDRGIRMLTDTERS